MTKNSEGKTAIQLKTAFTHEQESKLNGIADLVFSVIIYFLMSTYTSASEKYIQ